MKASILCLAAITTLAFTPNSKKHTLHFKLESDKLYSQTTSISTDSKQTFQGQEMQIQQFVSVKTSMELNESKDTLDNYALWYDDIAMEVTGMGTNQILNSDTTILENVDEASRVLNQIVGRKFNADIATSGRVFEVFGLEEIITEATVGSTGIAAMYADQFSAGFGDSGLAKNIEMVTDIWPKQDVEVGGSWTNEQFTPTGLPIIVKNNYTLESIEKGLGHIKVNAILEIDKNSNSTVVSGMEATYFLDGSRSGTIDFEVKTGWVTNAMYSDTIVGNIVLAPNEQIPEGMTIPVEFVNEILVETE